MTSFAKFYVVKADAKWWNDPNEEYGMSLCDEQPIYDVIEQVRKLQAKVTAKEDDPEPEEKANSGAQA